MSEEKFQVCICGGGNLAHFSAAVIGSKKNMIVNVFTRRPNDWKKTIIGKAIPGSSWEDKGEIIGHLNVVSDDPEKVSKGTKLFIVCGPAQVHPLILQKIAPFIEKNSFVGTCYAQGGFNMAAVTIIGAERIKKDNITIFGLFNVPSLAYITSYGNTVSITQPKKMLQVACTPKEKGPEICLHLENMYDIVATLIPNFLTLTLTPSNQIIHPARIYGIFKNWDGKTPLKREEVPYLYRDLDQFSADMLQVLDDEVQAIRYAINKKYPQFDLSYLLPIYDRILNQYGKTVSNPTNLKTTFNTCLAYSTVKVPLIDVSGGVSLNFKGRFFEEDIPYGLSIIKNIANLVQVNTPGCDKLIEWHQQFMGRKFIVNGNINPDTINETGTPQRYGFKTIEDLLELDGFKCIQ